VDAVFCLGDTVLFGPHPAACVELIRDRIDRVVRGNHDDEIVRFYCGSTEKEDDRTNASRWKEWTSEQLADDHIDYIASLPDDCELTLDGHRIRLRHDLPLPGPAIMPDASDEQIEARMDDRPVDHLFVGHVHIPYLRELGPRHLVDVGSVGQPEHGDGRASYVIWHDGKVTFHKVPYDVERTITDLKAVPLDRPYADLWGTFWRSGYVDRPALNVLESATGTR